ncbi:MAG: hypothetical protein GY705_29325 [Bacteroidetes bacterium]|nr:hypothetical protein [Bacteroidota bacterium]
MCNSGFAGVTNTDMSCSENGIGLADAVKNEKKVTNDIRIVTLNDDSKYNEKYKMSMSMSHKDDSTKCQTNKLLPPENLSEAYIWAYNINASAIIVHRFKAY